MLNRLLRIVASDQLTWEQQQWDFHFQWPPSVPSRSSVQRRRSCQNSAPGNRATDNRDNLLHTLDHVQINLDFLKLRHHRRQSSNGCFSGQVAWKTKEKLVFPWVFTFTIPSVCIYIWNIWQIWKPYVRNVIYVRRLSNKWHVIAHQGAPSG